MVGPDWFWKTMEKDEECIGDGSRSDSKSLKLLTHYSAVCVAPQQSMTRN